MKPKFAVTTIASYYEAIMKQVKGPVSDGRPTSSVVRTISSSLGDLESVFDAMLANATRLCEAKFGVLWRARKTGSVLLRCIMHLRHMQRSADATRPSARKQSSSRP
jgi:hypothetical protein